MTIKEEIDQLLLEVINCSNACCIECADNRKKVKKLFDKYEKAVEEKHKELGKQELIEKYIKWIEDDPDDADGYIVDDLLTRYSKTNP